MEIIYFFEKNNEFYFLSNFYKSEITIDDIKYNCVEQYFQSQKFYQPHDEKSMEYCDLIINADSPQKTKNMGSQKINYRGTTWYVNKNNKNLGKMNEKINEYKNIKIRNDWDIIKNDVMRKGLMAKFTQNDILKKKLLDTQNKILVENSPYDSYWGNAKCGQNMLGKLLMEIRENIRIMT